MDQLKQEITIEGKPFQIRELSGKEFLSLSRDRALKNASQSEVNIKQLLSCIYTQNDKGDFKRISEAEFEGLPNRVISKLNSAFEALNRTANPSEAIAGLAEELLERTRPPEASRQWLESLLSSGADAPLLEVPTTTQSETF